MPLKTPFSASNKSDTKPKGKGVPASAPAKGKGGVPPARGKDGGKASAPKKGKAAPPPQTVPAPPTWWETLSPERKLDVVGAVMAVVGLGIVLVLFSPVHSAAIDTVLTVISQMIGWGSYALSFGMIVMGVWLILRRIEKLPPLSLERATGIVLFFIWLLAVMHFAIAEPQLAHQAALDGWGGGYIGSFLEIILFNSLGMLGSMVALSAWLVITVIMIFDISVEDLFRWVNPVVLKIREWSARPKTESIEAALPETNNGFTPLQRPQPVVPAGVPTAPVTTVRPADAVIHWKLPNLKDILDSGSAPSANEEFIQQRARLIQETLASFGAPVQVVEINRGPTITQFGVEPLFVETRGGRTKVRVNKIASLADDLALALAAPRIRIQAPVPGHSYVGIEVPNEEMTLVALRDLLESDALQRNTNPL